MSLLANISEKKEANDLFLKEIKAAKESSYIHKLEERVAHLIWRDKINGENSDCLNDWDCAQKKINNFVMNKFNTYGESFESVLRRYINSTAHYYYIYRNMRNSLDECKKAAIDDVAFMVLY